MPKNVFLLEMHDQFLETTGLNNCWHDEKLLFVFIKDATILKIKLQN